MLIDIKEIETLTLKPNQVLVVKTAKIWSSTDRMALKSAFEAIFKNNKVIILDESIDLSVIEDCTNATR